MSKQSLIALGEVYCKAWLVSGGEFRRIIEHDCIQVDIKRKETFVLPLTLSQFSCLKKFLRISFSGHIISLVSVSEDSFLRTYCLNFLVSKISEDQFLRTYYIVAWSPHALFLPTCFASLVTFLLN